MIGRLVGLIAHEEPTGAVLIDVRGVGYELTCPIGAVARAQRVRTGDHEHVVLHVHTNVRQDAFELFGFSGPEERTAFRQLITVPNVGPRLALSVLNVLTAEELVSAIDSEDKARLSKVPGVGKKTAERLVLELRGKLPRATSFVSKQVQSSGIEASVSSRLVAALTGLGYRPASAEKAAAALVPRDGSGELSALLREALKYLAS